MTLKEDIQSIRKHIKILNEEMGGLEKAQIEMKTDLKWIKKTYWVIFTASIGALIAGIINLL